VRNVIWIWLGVVVSLLLIEYMSKNFTAICFVISGIISCISTHFHAKYSMQVALFLFVGIFIILVLRPYALEIMEKEKQSLVDKKSKEVKENSKKKRKKEKTKKKK